jgi:hypothetical protein
LAQERGLYPLVVAGKKESFTARNAMVIKVSKAQYNADTMILVPKTTFTVTQAKPVELMINGLAPSGLRDSLGRLIDGAQNGQPGSDAIAVLSKNVVTIE